MDILLFCLGIFGVLPVFCMSVLYGAVPVLMFTMLVVGWLDPKGRAGLIGESVDA